MDQTGEDTYKKSFMTIIFDILSFNDKFTFYQVLYAGEK